MPEWPEFRSDHDPKIAGTATAPAPAKRSLGRRVRSWVVLAVFLGGLFAMAGGGIWYGRRAIRNGHWDDLPLALGLLLPLVFIVWQFVRNKVRTGRWGGNRQEPAQRVERMKARRPQIQAQARLRPASLGRYVMRWAGYAAFEPTCSAWQRAVAWTILVSYGLYMLLLAVASVFLIGAAFADGKAMNQRLLSLGLGLVFVMLAGGTVVALVRRKRAGSLRVTRAEYGALQGQRAAWRVRESQKPLRVKVISIVASILFEVWWWMRVTVYHSRHPRESWVGPLISLPAFVWVIWVQVRAPKKAVVSKQ